MPSTVKQPFEAWITKAESDVNGLLQQASDSKRLLDAKENLEGIQKAAKTKENDVSALSDLSLKFAQSREVSMDDLSYYCLYIHILQVHDTNSPDVRT